MLQDYSGAQKTGMAGNWLEVFDTYSVQFVVLDRHSDGELLSRLHAQPDWKIDFDDGEDVIFARAHNAWSRRTTNLPESARTGIK
ncbi:MAG: hypothetical protein JW850_13410 [Thermoflexales bacterium]|nr:hypothetical protein [Thermoflexales bacterium]